MPCYICLEEGQMTNLRGCYCKGGIEIHQTCLQKWMLTAENPFNCSVCKCEYPITFLKKFLTDEEIMYHPKGIEEDDADGDYNSEEEVDFHSYSGITFITTEDGIMVFETEKHKNVYLEMVNKEEYDIKKELRYIKKNTMRFNTKTSIRRPTKWNKTVAFRK